MTDRDPSPATDPGDDGRDDAEDGDRDDAGNDGRDEAGDDGRDEAGDDGRDEAGNDDGVPAWLPDPVVAYRLEADEPVVDAASRAFERTFELDPGAGRPLEAVLPDAVDASAGTLEAAVENRAHVAVVDGADDGDREFLLRVVPQAATEADRGYLLFTDVTELGRRIATLEEERDRFSRFASVVAHDVQNPIGTARLRVRTAREDAEDVHFEKALGAIDRMESILEDALRLVRQGQIVDELEAVDLATAAEDAWTTVESEAASLSLGEDLPTVTADPGPLRELLENLFHNAVEHAGPAVTVTVAARPGGFAVADDGPGVPPDEREAVLEPGYSGADGTGLGLAIVERIAEDHGWSVAVTDGPEGGCEVRVTGVDRPDDD